MTLQGWLGQSLGAIPLSLLFCLLAYAAAGPDHGGNTDAMTAPGPSPPSGHDVADPATTQPAAANPVAANPGAPRLLARLKPANKGALLRLSVEDHYTRVVTARGSELLLLRLTDAIAEAGDAGMQIHRSHWVAFDNMRRLLREENRVLLETGDGAQLPVSRPYAPRLREHLRKNANNA